jgi:hypothetical protein
MIFFDLSRAGREARGGLESNRQQPPPRQVGGDDFELDSHLKTNLTMFLFCSIHNR